LKLTLRCAAFLLLPALLWTACARQPIPSDASKQRRGQGGDQVLPFNQHKQGGGISPSSSLIPFLTEVPAGTPFTISLKSSIASATAHAGDSFQATLEEAIIVQGKPVFPAGTPVSGTIMAVNRSASARAPAYLRLRATSITWQGRIIPIESSSIFAKAGLSRAQQKADGNASGQGFSAESRMTGVPKTLRFAAGRSLTFRLTEPAVLSK
jgi:hypothetical protein